MAVVAIVPWMGFSAPPAGAQTTGYTAMGDSFAAGTGLKGGTAPCYRAPGSYPQLAAQSLVQSYPDLLLTDLACSGATMAAGILGDQSYGGQTIPAQLPLAEQAEPLFVSLTIGANDVRWLQILHDCADTRIAQPCDELATTEGTFEHDFDANLAAFQASLDDALSQISSWAVRPSVLLTLYNWPFPERYRKSCLDHHSISVSPPEFTYAMGLLVELNQAISNAAAVRQFATIDLRALFDGHDICSPDPWIFSNPNRSFVVLHPNVEGHQQITNAVVSAWSPP